MATNTTRLALVKPAASENYDVGVTNGNSDKIDAAVGRTSCTSTTRPSTPFTGQAIYETDTRNTLTWNGTAWAHETIPVVAATSAILAPYTNQRIALSTDGGRIYRYTGTVWQSEEPRGVVARNFRTTNSPTYTTILRIMSVRAPVISGRSYRVHFHGEEFAAGGAAVGQTELRFTTTDVEPTTTAGVMARALVHHINDAIPDLVTVTGLFHSTVNGFLRVVVCGTRAVGSVPCQMAADANFPAIITVEDIGLTVAVSGTVY